MSAESSTPGAAAEGFVWRSAVHPLLAAAGMGLLTYTVGVTWCLLILAIAIGLIGYAMGAITAVAAWGIRRRDRAGFAWRPLAVGLLLLATNWIFLTSEPLPTIRARRWCREILPALRIHRAQNGRYPSKLEEAGLRPPWLTSEIEYGSDGDSFDFNVVSPGDFTSFSGWSLSSRWHGWIHHD